MLAHTIKGYLVNKRVVRDKANNTVTALQTVSSPTEELNITIVELVGESCFRVLCIGLMNTLVNNWITAVLVILTLVLLAHIVWWVANYDHDLGSFLTLYSPSVFLHKERYLSEINASPDGQMLHLLINGKSYKISELGSGLTQFFLVLASAVIRSSTPSYILIDEPEINLHPSLQLDFLTRLTAYANHGILFATHSVGLARASADHIYSVRRSPDGQSEITDYNSTPRLAELLGELSFSGYKELGFDKILLV